MASLLARQSFIFSTISASLSDKLSLSFVNLRTLDCNVVLCFCSAIRARDESVAPLSYITQFLKILT